MSEPEPVPTQGLPDKPHPGGPVTGPQADAPVAAKRMFAFPTGWFTRVKSPPCDVPEVAAVGFVDSGQVYISGASTPIPDGQKVVLVRPDSRGRLELTVTTPGEVPAAYKARSHTYLSAIDRTAFGSGSRLPTVRRYRWYDSVGKLFSLAGLLVAVPAVAGAVGAWATLFGVLSPAPTELNINSMQAALAWAAEPLTTLPAHPDPAAETAAATEFEHRSIRATACVQSLQGHRGSVAQVPQIDCRPKSSSWVQRHGGLVATVMTTVVMLFGIVTAIRRTRFQQSP